MRVSDGISNVILDDMLKMKINCDKDDESEKNQKSRVEKSMVDEKMAEFAFTSNLDDIGAPQVEFKTPDRFESKKEHVKETRSQKKMGNLTTPIEENLETSESYSPRDISPYENTSNDNFTFAAASSSQYQHKKKHLLKITHDSYTSASDPKNSYLFDSRVNIKPVNEQDFTLSSSKIAEEACEKWRLRGNQAYNNGELVKADDCYTKGLNSVSENENSRSCLRAMMLCYSNRAATRVSLGKMKEALGDCLMAANIDPNFLKVQIRAAHCYLAIGETENAKQQYMKCLQSVNPNSEDKKVIVEEASEGLEKAQKVSECIKQYTDLYQRRASEDLESALRVINEALKISTSSEKLLEMKADALFMLQRYEEVIQMCEESLNSDETDTPTSSSSRLWRSHLIVKSYFYLGKLEDALEFIKKQENSDLITERSQESRIPLADTIRDLLSCKKAGNEAYKSGKLSEAVEHYTTALLCNVQSRLFASVCFCNRAAAFRGLGQITDAISDCSLAIALDPNYLKAISRRAGLYEMIRDYGQVAIDLQRLVDKYHKLRCMNELKKTQLWLTKIEEESRKGIPLNMYLILGSESSSSAADIKKAYRKAALRHHPDKAAQSLVRSEDGDDELWKEIAENVYKDADRLFKMIGEAYAVLSNPLKRSKYDEGEEMRNEPHRFTRTNSSRSPGDAQDSRRYSKYY